MSRILVTLGVVATATALVLAQQGGRPGKFQAQVPWALKRAIEMGPRLRYVGTRVVEFRKDGQPVKYSEIVTKDGPNLRIEFPSGSAYAGQVIVDTPQERRHFFPDKNEIHVMPPRREEAMARLVRMVKRPGSFAMSSANGDVVAGVPTVQVVVSDKNGNVLQRLFISRSGALLKRQMFDPVGTPVGGFEFAKIDFSPSISPAVFRLERRGAKLIRPVDMLRDLAADKGFPFAYLRDNSGYRLMFSRVNQVGGKDVLMQFYASEGSRLSLFEVKSALDPAQFARFGKDVQTYSWTNQGTTFVMVANQDVATLKHLANYVAYGTSR